MESAIEAAIIGAVASLAAAVVGGGLRWAKKRHDKPETGSNVAAHTRNVSESLVAVGTNITQHQGTVQNYYGTVSPAAGPSHWKVATRPSIIEIGNAIRAARPYEKTQISKNYIGLEVSWPLTFFSISQNLKGNWSVMFTSPEPDNLAVSVDIDIDKYPKLKVVEQGHAAWIEGRILRIDIGVIDLEKGALITLE